MIQESISIRTSGRGSLDITEQVAQCVQKANVANGLCHVFLMHTSASLMLCENYDPVVREDLERFMSRITPDGDSIYQHTAEGPDDMPAHVRTVLTHNDITVPIIDRQLALGSWQGIFLWEHRTSGHQRRLIVSIK